MGSETVITKSGKKDKRYKMKVYILKECEVCNINFLTRNTKREKVKKCCSNKCSSKLPHLWSPIGIYECDVCKKEYEAPKTYYSYQNKQKYCSDQCRKQKYVHNCKNCKVEFRSSKKQTNFCSMRCRTELSNKTVVKCICVECNQDFERPQRLIKKDQQNTFCSIKCGNRFHERKNERSSMRYGGRSWDKKRLEIFDRDKKCRSCNQWYNGKYKMCVHHIIEIEHFDSYIEANYNENLVTLCWKCHRKVHSGKIENKFIFEEGEE